MIFEYFYQPKKKYLQEEVRTVEAFQLSLWENIFQLL